MVDPISDERLKEIVDFYAYEDEHPSWDEHKQMATDLLSLRQRIEKLEKALKATKRATQNPRLDLSETLVKIDTIVTEALASHETQEVDNGKD